MDSVIETFGDEQASKRVLIGRGYTKEETYIPQSGKNKGIEQKRTVHWYEPATVVRENGEVKMTETTRDGKTYTIPELKRTKGTINFDDLQAFKAIDWPAKSGLTRSDFYAIFKESIALGK
jgi:hypothetical protein